MITRKSISLAFSTLFILTTLLLSSCSSAPPPPHDSKTNSWEMEHLDTLRLRTDWHVKTDWDSYKRKYAGTTPHNTSDAAFGKSYLCVYLKNSTGKRISFSCYWDYLSIRDYSLEEGRQVRIMTAIPLPEYITLKKMKSARLSLKVIFHEYDLPEILLSSDLSTAYSDNMGTSYEILSDNQDSIYFELLSQ